MATLTVNDIVKTGFREDNALVAAAAGGDEFANTGREFLMVANADASATTVTAAATGSAHGQDLEDEAISVPAGQTFVIGPFPPLAFNDSNQKVQLTYSKVTSLTVGVFKLPNPTT